MILCNFLVLIFCFILIIYTLNEIGGACGAYGGGERCAQGSSGET